MYLFEVDGNSGGTALFMMITISYGESQMTPILIPTITGGYRMLFHDDITIYILCKGSSITILHFNTQSLTFEDSYKISSDYIMYDMVDLGRVTGDLNRLFIGGRSTSSNNISLMKTLLIMPEILVYFQNTWSYLSSTIIHVTVSFSNFTLFTPSFNSITPVVEVVSTFSSLITTNSSDISDVAYYLNDEYYMGLDCNQTYRFKPELSCIADGVSSINYELTGPTGSVLSAYATLTTDTYEIVLTFPVFTSNVYETFILYSHVVTFPTTTVTHSKKVNIEVLGSTCIVEN